MLDKLGNMSLIEVWQHITAATHVRTIDDLLALPACQADTFSTLQAMFENGQMQLARLDRELLEMEVRCQAQCDAPLLHFIWHPSWICS
jgi:hypothetical protein